MPTDTRAPGEAAIELDLAKAARATALNSIVGFWLCIDHTLTDRANDEVVHPIRHGALRDALEKAFEAGRATPPPGPGAAACGPGMVGGGRERVLVDRLEEQVGKALREKIGDDWAYGPAGTVSIRLGVEEARAILFAAPAAARDDREGDRQGATPMGSGSQASPEAPTDLRPEGFDPSRGPAEPFDEAAYLNGDPKITWEELRAIFGDTMPADALTLLDNTPVYATIAETRAALIEMAERQRALGAGQAPYHIRMAVCATLDRSPHRGALSLTDCWALADSVYAALRSVAPCDRSGEAGETQSGSTGGESPTRRGCPDPIPSAQPGGQSAEIPDAS